MHETKYSKTRDEMYFHLLLTAPIKFWIKIKIIIHKIANSRPACEIRRARQMIISAEYARLQNRVEQLEALNLTRGVTHYKKILFKNKLLILTIDSRLLV